MTLAEIFAMASSLLDDTVEPYRWTDFELLAYINDSINELCEQAKILVDSTTEPICKINVEAGRAKYLLDPRVIEIRRGRLLSADRRITRRSRAFMDAHCHGWDSSTASSGTPKYFIEDLDTGYITLYPTPSSNDTLWLTVARYPLIQLTVDMKDQAPEIHFKYHYKLLDGILGRAYLKQDTETYDAQKAERHLTLWKQTVHQAMLDEINRYDIDDESNVPDYLER